MEIKGVLFDLDGVITDTAEFHYQAWKNMADSVDIKISKEFNEELKGISRMESLERILEHGNKQDVYSTLEKEKLAEKKNHEYVELLNDLEPSDIYPGILSLISELKERKIKLAIASASKNAPKILKKLKIIEEFDLIVNPNSVSKGKPAPDIFIAAAKGLNLENSQCIGIEDSEAGIHSIKSAGQFAVGVGTYDIMKSAGADWVVSDTKELTFTNLKQNFQS